MILFSKNPATLSWQSREGAVYALRAEHPAMDAPIDIPLGTPGRLSDKDAATYNDGQGRSARAELGFSQVQSDNDMAVRQLGGDLIEALASLDCIDQRHAECIVDAWEPGGVIDDAEPIRHAS